MNTLSKPILSTRQTLVIGSLVLGWFVAYNLIQPLANWIYYSLFGLARDSRLGESLAFYAEIMKYPLLSAPGLVINEKLVVSGRVPSEAEITTFLTNEMEKI